MPWGVYPDDPACRATVHLKLLHPFLILEGRTTLMVTTVGRRIEDYKADI